MLWPFGTRADDLVEQVAQFLVVDVCARNADARGFTDQVALTRGAQSW